MFAADSVELGCAEIPGGDVAFAEGVAAARNDAAVRKENRAVRAAGGNRNGAGQIGKIERIARAEPAGKHAPVPREGEIPGAASGDADKIGPVRHGEVHADELSVSREPDAVAGGNVDVDAIERRVAAHGGVRG